MKATYVIQRGETLTLSLNIIEGDIATVQSITVKLKKAGPRGTVPPLGTPVLLTFTETTRPAELGPGWTFSLSPAESASLEPGFYIVGADIVFTGGTVEKTNPLLIEIEESV